MEEVTESAGRTAQTPGRIDAKCWKNGSNFG
jgi:hypothetical protein